MLQPPSINYSVRSSMHAGLPQCGWATALSVDINRHDLSAVNNIHWLSRTDEYARRNACVYGLVSKAIPESSNKMSSPHLASAASELVYLINWQATSSMADNDLVLSRCRHHGAATWSSSQTDVIVPPAYADSAFAATGLQYLQVGLLIPCLSQQ